MNPLDEFPALRRVLYLIQWLLSVALFVVTAVVMVVTDGNAPVWLTATTAGFNAFTAITGLTAQSNTVNPETDVAEIRDDDGDPWDVYEDDEDVNEGVDLDEGDPELDLELSKE